MLKSKFLTAKSLAPMSWKALLYGLLHVPFAFAILKLWGFKFTQSVYRCSSVPDLDRTERSKRMHEIDRGFSLAVKYSLLRGTCLSRALVLNWLLQSHGVRSNLSIGFRHAEDERFDAHAWVDSPDGIPGISRQMAADYKKILY